MQEFGIPYRGIGRRNALASALMAAKRTDGAATAPATASSK
jgi:hypothetical protein